MAKPTAKDASITCPCCGASLKIDLSLGRVISHQAPPRPRGAVPDLEQAGALLRQQAEKREALFKQSTEDEKIKTQLLERKFRDALEKSKDEPVLRPTRDIDLD